MTEANAQRSTPENVCLDTRRAEFEALSRQDILEMCLLHQAPFAHRLSDLLVEEMREGIITSDVHVPTLVQELCAVERGERTETGCEEPFRGPLRGLYKKHFFSSRFLNKNVQLSLCLNRPGSEKLLNIVKHAVKRKSHGKGPQELALLASQIARDVLEPFYERKKNGKLTGEWLIFCKHGGRNFYLTIGLHGDDQSILHKLKARCVKQYPFLVAQVPALAKNP